MQENKELTMEEKARLMHNHLNREWARKNKEKVKASQIKCLAKKYDEMMSKEQGGQNE